MLLRKVNSELVKHITRVALKVKVSLSLDHKHPTNLKCAEKSAVSVHHNETKSVVVSQ